MARRTGLTIVLAATLLGWPGGVTVFRAQTSPPLMWLDATGRPTAHAQQALAFIDTAGQHGLIPDHYRPTRQPSEGARFDSDLTRGLHRFLHDLHLGRVDGRAIGYNLPPRTDTVDLAAIVRDAAATGRFADIAASLAPRMREYSALQQALARYRTLAASSEAPLPIWTKVIRPGDPLPGAAALRHHLGALGDLPSGNGVAPADAYTADLADAVSRFQRRHGLNADGILGRATQGALRVSLRTRVRQIELALERLRWLPRDSPGAALIVNIPMFRMWSSDLTPARMVPPVDMKVIVGRTRVTPTPVFTATMETVVFRPYWNIPSSILITETLPAIRKDSQYLARNDMEIVRGEGDGPEVVPLSAAALDLLEQGALRVRQRPGPENALGLIKFVFPNAMSVFMHGTPAQRLFERERRDFSHGCIRVEDPVTLAVWVLNRPEWSREAVIEATQGADSRSVPVAGPIRVIVFYSTAWALPSGALHFADDIYGRDPVLSRALAENYPRL